MPEPAIALKGVERRYGERVALSGVEVELAPGQTLAVLGANGAGKTTLLRVLATLLRPHAGSAVVLGSALPADAWRVRGRLGYLGHDPLLYRELSGRQNLEYHARLHGVAAERVDEQLAAVGMERRADSPVRELSRGMVQRLAAARATLHDPDAAAAGRAARRAGPGRRRAAGAADRARVRAHARAGEPRRRGRAGRVRRGAGPGGRAPGVRAAGGRGRSRRGAGAVLVIAHGAGRSSARTWRSSGAPRSPSRPWPLFTRHRLRAVPLRPGPRLAGRRAGLGRAVGDAAAGGRDRGQPAVRRRARAGRHRRAAAGAGGPHRAVRGQGGGAVPVPGGRWSWWPCPPSSCCCWRPARPAACRSW